MNKVFIFLAVVVFSLSSLFGTSALAQDAEDVDRAYEGLIWAPDGLSQCQIGSFGITTLPDSVPEPYNSIFFDAAQEYGIDLAILTSIFFRENRGFPEPPPPYGDGDPWPVSRGGAEGPFQFLPGTWANAGVDANGDGEADVNDLIDASYGAANFILELGGVAGIPLGDLSDAHFQYRDNQPGAVMTVARVFKSYNAGQFTWRDPNSGLWLRNVGGSPTPWDDQKQGEINAYITVSLEMYVELATGGATSGSGNSCTNVPGGSIGISPDGFVFPLITTKQKIMDGVDGARWCYASLSNCHHDYNAADIFAETGTVVIAVMPGRVVRVVPNEDSGVGSRVVIVGTDDPTTTEVEDAITYYYTHMGPGTIRLRVGDLIDKGERIGEIGTNAQAVGTVRHLHFDMLPPPYDSRPGCSGAACTSYPFINVQPFLVPAFERLVEN